MKNHSLWSAARAILAIFSVTVLSLYSCAVAEEIYPSITDVSEIDGFIGCFYENICQSYESCFDDGLFGKCVDEQKAEVSELEPDEFSTAQLDRLSEKLPFYLTGSWSSLLTQCQVRSLIFSIKFDLPESFVEKTCGSNNTQPILPISAETDTILTKRDDTDDLVHQILSAKDLEEDDAQDFYLTPPELDIDGEEDDGISEPFDSIDSPQVFLAEEQVVTSNDNGDKSLNESVWLKFQEPLKSESDAKVIADQVAQTLDAENKESTYKLSPNGKTLQVDITSHANEDASSKPELIKRLRRYAESSGDNIKDYGIGIEKREQTENEALELNKNESKRSTKPIIIAASVVGGTVFVVLAVSAPFIARCIRAKKGTGIRLNPGELSDDVKCLTDPDKKLHPDSAEGVDSLGPLGGDARNMVKEARKSAQNFLAGATDYFSSFTRCNQNGEQESPRKASGKVIKKQTSNSSIASTSSFRTSISSWSSEPVKMDLDLNTTTMVLDYLEKHLKDKNKLDEDWRAVCSYEADDAVICEAATRDVNLAKNRPGASLPYEQSRVKLRSNTADYINASIIFDVEPRTPAYVATQTPMESTMRDFWRMVWDQGSVTIVALDRPDNIVKPDDPKVMDDPTAPVQYWPDEGVEQYAPFEVNLVSEHTFCGKDYMVRSFYLKNTETNETRTVSQFHFQGWPLNKPMEAIETMLEFRRRVNKSYRGQYSPILVHCPDGAGATGTYMLLDMTLNRIQKGLKEFDLCSSLEFLRDQRQGVVQTKDQFEFVLSALADELTMLIKLNNTNDEVNNKRKNSHPKQ